MRYRDRVRKFIEALPHPLISTQLAFKAPKPLTFEVPTLLGLTETTCGRVVWVLLLITDFQAEPSRAVHVASVANNSPKAFVAQNNLGVSTKPSTIDLSTEMECGKTNLETPMARSRAEGRQKDAGKEVAPRKSDRYRPTWPSGC